MINPISPESVSAIESILNDTPVEEKVIPKTSEEETNLAEEDSQDETSVDDESDITATEEESEEETSEETSEEESDETPTDEDDNLLTEEYFEDTFVDIDGERVNLGELKAGFLRQSDYTKKTQELSAQRKEAEKAVAEADMKASNLIKQRFEMVSMEVEKRLNDFKNVDWTALARSNPNDYTALKAEYDQALNEARAIEKGYLDIQAKQQEHYAKQAEETAKASYETLKQDIPGWGKELYSNMVNYAVDSGMPEDVVSNIVEAPVLKLLYKAYMFDKGKTELKDKVKPKDKPSVKSKLKKKSVVTDSNKQKSEKKVANLKQKLSSTTNKTDRNALSTALIADILGDD